MSHSSRDSSSALVSPEPAAPAPPAVSADVLLRRIHATRRVAVAGTLALIALGLLWELWLAPLPGGTGAMALKVLPLTLPLAGLLKLRMYTYRWTSLLVWLYVTEALVRLTSEGGVVPLLAGLELAFSLLLFVACAAHVRLRLAHGAALGR